MVTFLVIYYPQGSKKLGAIIEIVRKNHGRFRYLFPSSGEYEVTYQFTSKKKASLVKDEIDAYFKGDKQIRTTIKQ